MENMAGSSPLNLHFTPLLSSKSSVHKTLTCICIIEQGPPAVGHVPAQIGSVPSALLVQNRVVNVGSLPSSIEPILEMSRLIAVAQPNKKISCCHKTTSSFGARILVSLL